MNTSVHNAGLRHGSSGGLEFDALIPASLGSAIQAEVGTPLVLVLVTQSARIWSAGTEYIYLQLKPKVLVSKMSGFFFSSYGVTAEATSSNIIVGMNTYQRMFDMCVQAAGLNATDLGLPMEPPKRKLYIRLKDGVTANQVCNVLFFA